MTEVTKDSITTPATSPIQDTSTDNNLSALDQSLVLSQKYGRVAAIVLGILVAAGLAFAGYKYYIGEQDNEAQTYLFKAVYAFEADSLDRALNGKAGNPGMLGITEDYAGTPAASQAHFYAGVIYLKKGKYEDAIEHLKAFDGNDLLVQARAYSLIGDAYSEQKQYDEASKFYQKAAEHHPNKLFTPAYLMKLALTQEAANDKDAALGTYAQIIQKYPDAQEAPEAKKGQAMLQTLKGE
jgi:TolA-binding protein